jgi:DNA polymerase V
MAATPVTHRLNQFIETAFRGNVSAFARAIDYPRGGLHKYLVGTNQPGGTLLNKLYAAGCDVNWLLSGAGEMFADNDAGQALRYQLGMESALDGVMLEDDPHVSVERIGFDPPTKEFEEAFRDVPKERRHVASTDELARKVAALRPYAVTASPKIVIPLFLEPVSAGHPEPVEGHIDRYLNVEEWMVPSPQTTFAVVARGRSMLYDMIAPGDVIFVDRALKVVAGMVVVCVLDGEVMVKRYQRRGRNVWLHPANDEFAPVEVTSEMALEILGVVGKVVHDLNP